MPAGLQRATRAACQQNWKVIVIVRVAVRNAAAVNDHRIVEQRAVAFLDRLQLIEEVAELPHVKLVDRRDLLFLVQVAAVMGEIVMTVADADKWVAPIAAVVGNDKGGDSRRVSLKCER